MGEQFEDQTNGSTEVEAADALPKEADVAVVGLGLMGAAAAFALSRRGRAVVALDAYAAGHTRGSSHGASRIVRRAYTQPHYVTMTGEALEGWEELETLSGRRLLTMTGGLHHGRSRDLEALYEALRAAGVACTVLSAGAASERWPQLRFHGPVLHHPQAGVVDPDVAIEELTRLAVAGGAIVMREAPVLRVEVAGDVVRLHTPGGTLTATQAVVAAGPWIPELLAGVVLLPRLTVTQQQVFFFPVLDQYSGAGWPVVLHDELTSMYLLPAGRDGRGRLAIKVGDHAPGAATTASGRDGIVDAEARDDAVAYVRAWCPGLVPEPLAEASCLYTWTPSEDFFLGTYGPLIVVSACSGHGAKFAPLIGRWTADLIDGRPLPYAFFDRAAHGAA